MRIILNNIKSIYIYYLLFNLFLLFTFAVISPAIKQIIFSDRFINYVHQIYGEAATARVLKWQDLIIENADKKEMDKLNAVNNYFNRITQISDLDNYNEKDHWATPLELLAMNGGDCEDIAIAKYFTLKKLNMEEKSLWLTYVRAYSKNRIVPHMVLAYYPAYYAEPLILDNLMQNILPASKRKDLKPTYSFNVSGLWAAKERSRGKYDGGANRVYRWRDLLERMEGEGF